MPGKYLRGALISFSDAFPLPLPNLILFQYNPEQLTHQWAPSQLAPAPAGNPLAITGEPGEKFTFTLYVDATDSIADDGAIGAALGTVSGVATRLAALEMLLFPVAADSASLTGSVSAAAGAAGAAIGAAAGAGAAAAIRPVPEQQLPTVLFVWGPGRIVPVRVSALSITETHYDALLTPTHAQAQVTLDVLTTAQIAHLGGTFGKIARGAYRYTSGARKALALANLGNAVGSVSGMLAM
jgi:hypothetical protein